MTREAAQEILDFLNSIEGAGYGGMASFEIARQHVRVAVEPSESPWLPIGSFPLDGDGTSYLVCDENAPCDGQYQVVFWDPETRRLHADCEFSNEVSYDLGTAFTKWMRLSDLPA